MKTRTYVIYIYTNKSNGKSYVGFTYSLEKRDRQHITSSNSEKESKQGFHGALRKYGRDNFSLYVLEKDIVTEQKAFDAEVFWIAYLKSIGTNLYNLTRGGDTGPSWKGVKKSPEHIERIAAAHRGMKRPPITLERMSKALKGKNAGEHSYKATLTNAQAKEIHLLYATGQYTHASLANLFGVSDGVVSHILGCKTFKAIAIDLPRVNCCKDCGLVFPRNKNGRAQRCNDCRENHMRDYYRTYNETRR